LRLSTRGHYGLKAMFDLALHYGENPIPLKSVAERQGISDNYLEQLISVLRKAGLVKSVRGAQGGYILARSPENINVGEIIRAMEGPIAPVNCVSEVEPTECDQSDVCITRAVWARVRDSIAEVLDSISLADMCRDAERIKKIQNNDMHYIQKKEESQLRRVYMDHSATTPVRTEVAEEMYKYITEYFGNPTSLHYFGRQVRNAVEEAREKVAKAIGAKTNEIVFTSGGTESDNMAIHGVAYANKNRGNHIITSAVEHHAVLNTVKALGKEGFTITILPVDKYGMVNPDDVANAITDKTILVTIMHANNEVGTIQPIQEISKITREHGVIFHTDAVQSFGKIPVNVDDLGVDLLTISGHKIYAPKGIGALYIRKGTRWKQSLFHGGAQERLRRAGTENVPGIIALGKACELAVENLESEAAYLSKLRDRLIEEVIGKISHVTLTGHPTKRIPGHASFCFRYIEGESMLLSLDMKGIAASSGSACTSGSLEPSHVLLAMDIPHEVAHGSIRLTLGRDNTEEDIDYFMEVIVPIVERLRSMSPLDQETEFQEMSECEACKVSRSCRA